MQVGSKTQSRSWDEAAAQAGLIEHASVWGQQWPLLHMSHVALPAGGKPQGNPASTRASDVASTPASTPASTSGPPEPASRSVASGPRPTRASHANTAAPAASDP